MTDTSPSVVEVEKQQDMGVSAERWLPVPGFEDRYEVSDLGRVRSLYFDPPRIATPYPDKDGYPVIGLWRDQARTQMNLHRLVAEVFVPGRSELHREAAHLDGVRTNCRAVNLKWVSKVENHSHKRLHGTLLTGSRHPRSKLTEEQALEVRSRSRRGESPTALGREFGVHEKVVRDIRSGRLWRCLPQSDAPNPTPLSKGGVSR